MIFSMSPGTEGHGEERYTVYLPFVLSPGADLNVVDSRLRLQDSGIDLRIERLHHRYALTATPLPSEAAGRLYLAKLQAALLWFSLKRGSGVSYAREVASVKLWDAPIPLDANGLDVGKSKGWVATDGTYDADKALVLPEYKRLVRFEMGQATVKQTYVADSIFAPIKEALSFPAPQQVAMDTKLKLAIELYAAHRFEVSDNAMFITVVTALEALLPSIELPEVGVAALDAAKDAVRKQRDKHQPDAAEWSAVSRLLSRIGNLSTESIGMTLRQFVSEVLERHPDIGDTDATLDALREVYDIRSTLLHEGTWDQHHIAVKLGWLREFVPKLLQVLFVDTATKSA